MKFISILIFLLSLNCFADDKSCEQLSKEGATKEQLAQSGCCSWHGGVCGCNGGRATCCDGTLSPSCGCHGEDNKFYTEEEKEKNIH